MRKRRKQTSATRTTRKGAVARHHAQARDGARKGVRRPNRVPKMRRPRRARRGTRRDPRQELPPEAGACLTRSQIRTALEWLTNGFNRTKAYRVAHPGCSLATARVEGARTIRHPKVRQFIAARFSAGNGPDGTFTVTSFARVREASRNDIELLFGGDATISAKTPRY
jgi:hypothetical protein